MGQDTFQSIWIQIAYWWGQVTESPLFTAVIGALVAALIAFAVPALIRWIRFQSVYSFWRPLIAEPISIIWSEYSNEHLTDGNEMIALVRKLGIKYFLSKGNALAYSTISRFLSRDIHFHAFKPFGDKTFPNHSEGNWILIGSPATNHYSRVVFKNLNDNFDMTFEIKYDESNVQIIDLENKRTYATVVDHNNCGVDYALIVRMHTTNTPSRCCLILCGASMWGVEGAAYAVTSPKIIKKVSHILPFSKDIAFLIKVDVINDVAENPEVVKIGRRQARYVRAMRKKRST